MFRREFIGQVAGAVAASQLATRVGNEAVHQAGSDWRSQFPALRQRVNGHPLTYLDTAATSLRPQVVIDALGQFDATDNANPGAALHTLARRASASFDEARRTAAEFVGATDPLEVVFTRGTTEGLNLVAATWGTANVRSGDEILVGVGEHSSNMLPWRALAARTGARMVYFGLTDAGYPDLADLAAKIGPRTRIVAVSHVSNVLGLINPIAEICSIARGPNRIVVVDAAQSAPHLATEVRTIGCDFLALSSHKLLGPMGAGVLWGRRELLESMPAWHHGSNMAHDVGLEHAELSAGALKFGAGTPNVSGAIGLAAALRYLRSIGFAAIRQHQERINVRMLERLAALPTVRLIGAPDARARVGVFAFVVQGRTPAQVVAALDEAGVAIRGGDLAALPLLERFGTTRAARASCYLYTNEADIDRFGDALASAVRHS